MTHDKPGTKPFGTAPGEQATLARMIELHAAGLALNSIALELDKAGLRTRGGGPWWGSTVVGILRQQGVITTCPGPSDPQFGGVQELRPAEGHVSKSDCIGLSQVGCETCMGIGRTDDGSICGCVNRKIFRIVYARVRHAMKGYHLAPVIRGSGGQSRSSRPNVNEDLIADFTLIGKRILSPAQHQLFRFAYILGADVQACAKRLGIDRETCFQRLKAIEAICGAYFRDCKPYPLFPLKSYFENYQPGGTRPCVPEPAVRIPENGAPMRPPISARPAA